MTDGRSSPPGATAPCASGTSSSGRAVWSVEAHPGRGCTGASLSPDGRQVASAGDDGMVAVWDVESKQKRVVARLGRDDAIGRRHSAPTGERLILPRSTARSVSSRSAATARSRCCAGTRGWSGQRASARTARKAVSAGRTARRGSGTFRPARRPLLRHPDAVIERRLQPGRAAGRDGRRGRDGARLERGRERAPREHPRRRAAGQLGPLQRGRAAARHGRRRWHGARVGRPRRTPAGRAPGPSRPRCSPRRSCPGPTPSSAAARTGRSGGGRLRPARRSWRRPSPGRASARTTGGWLSGGLDGAVRIWDTSTGSVRVLRGHDGRSYAQFTPRTASEIVSASEDGTVRVWDSGERASKVVFSGADAAVHRRSRSRRRPDRDRGRPPADRRPARSTVARASCCADTAASCATSRSAPTGEHARERVRRRDGAPLECREREARADAPRAPSVRQLRGLQPRRRARRERRRATPRSGSGAWTAVAR